jgi:multiple sugar transport system permease protein
MSNSGNLNGSNWAIILLHVGFQSGFCTFVLSNYMKLLPKELNEAAAVDGASMWTVYSKVVMPLTRPALAALATLEFAWIYNDFFWAVIFEQRGDDRPITSALANLGGEFVTDTNVVSAASIFVIIPVMIVYFALQKHFIAGLTLGANKG